MLLFLILMGPDNIVLLDFYPKEHITITTKDAAIWGLYAYTALITIGFVLAYIQVMRNYLNSKNMQK